MLFFCSSVLLSPIISLFCSSVFCHLLILYFCTSVFLYLPILFFCRKDTSLLSIFLVFPVFAFNFQSLSSEIYE